MKKEFKIALPNDYAVISQNLKMKKSFAVLEVELSKIITNPQFGDIVRVQCTETMGSKRNYIICVMPDKPIPTDYNDSFFDIANIDMGGKVSFSCGYYNDNIIMEPTERDIQEFHIKLALMGKKFDLFTHQIEDL